MPLNILPEDLLFMILLYGDNDTNCKLIRTCKHIFSCSRNGYLTSIWFDVRRNMAKMARTYMIHKNTVGEISLSSPFSNSNPLYWLPAYAETLIFDYPTPEMELDFGKDGCDVRKLVFNCSRKWDKNILKIRWESLPNLREISLDVYNVSLFGLEKLNLEKAYIKTDVCSLEMPGSRDLVWGDDTVIEESAGVHSILF